MFRLVVSSAMARVKGIQATVGTTEKAWGFLKGLWVLWCSCQGLLKLGVSSSQYLQWLQNSRGGWKRMLVEKRASGVARSRGAKDVKWDVVWAGFSCL